MKFYRGFTLIESLLVLFVITLFVALPSVAVKEAKETLEVMHFLDRFEKNILATQQAAITSNKRTRMIQRDTTTEYYFYTESIEKLVMPKDLRASRIKTLYFNSGTGNNSSLQELHFYWNKNKQKITYRFLFARGHYEKKVTALN
ncbi:competence type IV pilus minor pilin ComGD [Tetragenococcus muriaticus]|uniref:Putative ComYD family competence protein n=2 Tax=Tetragenococcus muriaticus TaxID=64642 RepID=A0A091C548_9ENTE|nr:competence type IV pilus minor pilin ComGD [Tetragenococcus muriaticus]KFN92931.1 putative ComYD family competence protein [Tetragenococcus muriaticus 3MR10-3]KFN93520.1 putative ComYD family competence protein [Tetragenococcus muriaticus PMC-11-5]GMA48393.1 competence protein [Tetragenococcus muriaticus]